MRNKPSRNTCNARLQLGDGALTLAGADVDAAGAAVAVSAYSLS